MILNNVRESIIKNLDSFKEVSHEEIINLRKNKFLKIGRHKGFINDLESLSDTQVKKNNLIQIFNMKKKFVILAGILLVSFVALLIFL